MGNWYPSAEFFRQLTSSEVTDSHISQPYPFCLSNPVEGEIEQFGLPQEYLAEWKWDGIRAQLIRRKGQNFFGLV